MNDSNVPHFDSGIFEKDEVNLTDILFSLKNHPKIKDAGSILTFTGIVRKVSKDGKRVRSLEINSYEETHYLHCISLY